MKRRNDSNKKPKKSKWQGISTIEYTMQRLNGSSPFEPTSTLAHTCTFRIPHRAPTPQRYILTPSLVIYSHACTRPFGNLPLGHFFPARRSKTSTNNSDSSAPEIAYFWSYIKVRLVTFLLPQCIHILTLLTTKNGTPVIPIIWAPRMPRATSYKIEGEIIAHTFYYNSASPIYSLPSFRS